MSDVLQIGQTVLVPGVVEDIHMGGRTTAPRLCVSVTVSEFTTVVYDREDVRTFVDVEHPGAAQADRAFEYLLNAMERSSQEDKPVAHGYADKRRAVLAYVRELERRAGSPHTTEASTSLLPGAPEPDSNGTSLL